MASLFERRERHRQEPVDQSALVALEIRAFLGRDTRREEKQAHALDVGGGVGTAAAHDKVLARNPRCLLQSGRHLDRHVPRDGGEVDRQDDDGLGSVTESILCFASSFP